MGEVVFWWVCSALWQEGRQLGGGSGHWGWGARAGSLVAGSAQADRLTFRAPPSAC